MLTSATLCYGAYRLRLGLLVDSRGQGVAGGLSGPDGVKRQTVSRQKPKCQNAVTEGIYFCVKDCARKIERHTSH